MTRKNKADRVVGGWQSGSGEGGGNMAIFMQETRSARLKEGKQYRSEGCGDALGGK